MALDADLTVGPWLVDPQKGPCALWGAFGKEETQSPTAAQLTSQLGSWLGSGDLHT